MNFLGNLNWKGIALTQLVLIIAYTTALPDEAQTTSKPLIGLTCKSLRREMSQLFEQAYQKMPALLDSVIATTHDHNSGRRFEFGAEAMKRLIVNAFTSYLPPCIHPIQGRDQMKMGKPQVPDGFLSEPQASLNPAYGLNVKNSSQKRARDSAPDAKLRRRRSSSSADIGSDYLRVNDAYIPLEMFQHHGGNEEEEEKNQITLELYV
jgi:hypothetical protein